MRCLSPDQTEQRREKEEQREKRKEEIVRRGCGERRYVIRADFPERLLEQRPNAKALDHHASRAGQALFHRLFLGARSRARRTPGVGLPPPRPRPGVGVCHEKSSAGARGDPTPGRCVPAREMSAAPESDSGCDPDDRDRDRAQNRTENRTPSEDGRDHPDSQIHDEPCDQGPEMHASRRRGATIRGQRATSEPCDRQEAIASRAQRRR